VSQIQFDVKKGKYKKKDATENELEAIFKSNLHDLSRMIRKKCK
jgi:hypothetical protein